MKKVSFKKALAAVAALSVVSCAAVPFASMSASAADSIEVSIDQRELTLDELQALNYKVPVYVRMNDDHPGICAAEFGVKSEDSACTIEIVTAGSKASKVGMYYGAGEPGSRTLEASGEGLDWSMTKADDGTFAWLTWSLVEDDDWSTNLVLVMVTVPTTAKAGDQFDITYQHNGLSGRSELFKDTAGTNFLTAGAVTGVDGYVKILDEQEETTTTTVATTTTTTTAATTTTTTAATTTTTTTAATTTTTTTAATTTTTTTAATTSTTPKATTTTTTTKATEAPITDENTETTTTTTTPAPSNKNNGTSKNNSNSSNSKSTTAASKTVAASPATGVSDILPIAGIAAAVAVLGGVAVVSKKKDDE